ncbi:MAG: hypothetical protein JNJ48_05815 [Phycisphaerae bacterium]|nr:hypothetical protein [Phycisphaerae bacterium]
MLTLWDLMKPVMDALRPRPAAQRKARRGPGAPSQRTAGSASANGEKPGAQDAYDRVVREMLERHRVRVRRWRTSMSGMAWEVRYADGSVARLIEAPRPKGPMSAAVFLHEIGHHAIGFNTYKPRCLEEYHAWRWSLEAMEANGLNVTDAVRRRMHESLWYAISKANRRGIRSLPAELEPYRTRPPRRRRGRGAGGGGG